MIAPRIGEGLGGVRGAMQMGEREDDKGILRRSERS